VWKIGSDACQCGIVLNDPSVSALHAFLQRNRNRWTVIDQMSKNGTYVNDAKVSIRILSPGDRVAFASVECEFRLPTKAASRFGRRWAFWSAAVVSFVAAAVVLWVLLRWIRS
jgi:pSer/pThr/pTyr-binding forkhead associated (FHA) protein